MAVAICPECSEETVVDQNKLSEIIQCPTCFHQFFYMTPEQQAALQARKKADEDALQARKKANEDALQVRKKADEDALEARKKADWPASPPRKKAAKVWDITQQTYIEDNQIDFFGAPHKETWPRVQTAEVPPTHDGRVEALLKEIQENTQRISTYTYILAFIAVSAEVLFFIAFLFFATRK